MILTKNIWLGTAALLVSTVAGQGADLPFRKAAPVDYVRVCDFVKGGGFFYVPGTDTCLKVGGIARAEYAYVTRSNTFYPNSFLSGLAGNAPTTSGIFVPSRSRSDSGTFLRAQFDVDARTQTAYGELRAFVRYRAERYGGNQNANATFAPSTTASGVIPGGAGTNTYVDKGYITFAGITAGRVQSFFDLYADNYNFEGIANSDESTSVLAYTATFGGGFSATISVEDPNGARRDGIGSITYGNTAIGAAANSGPAVNTVFGSTANYAGLRYPDAVLQLRYDQSWGAVQVAAAFHDVNTISANAVNGTGYTGASKAGFAVHGGVDLKLPMLAAGDELFMEGAYQQGAFLYQDSGANFSSGFFGSLLGGFQHLDVDAVAVGNTGTNGYHLELGEGFSGMLAFHHYFTPQFHDVLFGSYEQISYGNQVKNIDWTRGGIGDAQEFRVGNQFIFTPVHNLDFAVEVFYAKLHQQLAHEVGQAPTALPAGIVREPDSFEARLHIERDF